MALHWKALLVALVLWPFADFGGNCNVEALGRRVSVWRTADAVNEFRADCGRLPYSLEELTGPVVVKAACQGRVYARESLLRDGAGYLQYWKSADDSGFVVRSLGRDRMFGTVDDSVACQPRLGVDCAGFDFPATWFGTARVMIGIVFLPLLLALAGVSGLRALCSGLARWGRPRLRGAP